MLLQKQAERITRQPYKNETLQLKVSFFHRTVQSSFSKFTTEFYAILQKKTTC